MKQEEMKKKSADKAKKVQDLCEKLQMTLVPEQIVDKNGVIRRVIFYQDNENYPKEKDA